MAAGAATSHDDRQSRCAGPRSNDEGRRPSATTLHDAATLNFVRDGRVPTIRRCYYEHDHDMRRDLHAYILCRRRRGDAPRRAFSPVLRLVLRASGTASNYSNVCE